MAATSRVSGYGESVTLIAPRSAQRPWSSTKCAALQGPCSLKERIALAVSDSCYVVNIVEGRLELLTL